MKTAKVEATLRKMKEQIESLEHDIREYAEHNSPSEQLDKVRAKLAELKADYEQYKDNVEDGTEKNLTMMSSRFDDVTAQFHALAGAQDPMTN